MNSTEFLQKIDSLRGIVEDKIVINLYSGAESVFDNHNNKISDYKDDIKTLKQEKSDLDDTISDLETEIEELNSSNKFVLEGHHNNINTELVLEKLFNNLDRIPINQLETFINQY